MSSALPHLGQHCWTVVADAAKAHDEWAPFLGIDMWAGAVADQQGFIDVNFLNVYLERIGAHLLSQRKHVMHDAFHLDRAFLYPRGATTIESA